jgi:hypothetical protein
MKRKIIWSAALFVLACLTTSKAGRASSYNGPICNTFLGTACDGTCANDTCSGTQVYEYSCTDGSILYINE